MNFKKNIFFVFYSVILFILIAGFLRSSVSDVKAESSPVPVGSRPLKNLVIKDVKVETSDTEIKISGKLFNQSQNIATPQITHLMVLETIDPLIKPKDEIDQMPSLIVSADEGKDYFSLNPNRQKSFSYSFPASQYIPKANYRLSLSFIRSDGKEEAGYSEVIKDFGSPEKEGFLAFDQQSCVLFGRNGERFGNNSGPAFLPGESPKISCLIKNIGDKELEVYPSILWKEVFVYGKPLEGKLAEEKRSGKIVFNPGETKSVNLFMPIAEKPQTYQGLLSFKDGSGTSRSFNTFFRWTISGESARVKSVVQTGELKDVYSKGDIVSLSVDYFGSSDLYWAGTQAVSSLSGLTMNAVIKDKSGNICGKKQEILPEITDGFSKNKAVEVVLDKNCKGMNYSVSLSSGQKNLAEQSGDLPKLVNSQNSLQYFYFGAPAFMLLLAFYLFIRKKSVPVYVFIFALAGAAMFSVTVLAEMRTYPGYSGGGGTVSTWQWGGDWINTLGNTSATLYSNAYGTGGLNVLNPGYVTAQLANFFVSNTNTGAVEFEYYKDDTSCKNTSMEVGYKVYMSANGEENLLTEANIIYNNTTSENVKQYVSIPSDKINWLYNTDGTPKTDPKLIIKMSQIGFYLDYGDNGFYPGLFYQRNVSKEAPGFMTKDQAYASSDVIEIEVPLLLPTPTLRIDPPSAVINPGQKKEFSVLYDADGLGGGFVEADVTSQIKLSGLNNWSSDNTKVVTIGEGGWATAVRDGSAEIKAVYYRGLNAKAQISVPTFRVVPMSASITKGDSRQFNAYYDEDGRSNFLPEIKVTNKSTWSIKNLSAYEVIRKGAGRGLVWAIEKGFAKITASYLGLDDSSDIQVSDIPIALTVSCVAEPSSILVNEEITKFTATALGGTGTYSYAWTDDNGESLGVGVFINKSYSTTGTKNATVTVTDAENTAMEKSCLVEVKAGTIGECDTTNNSCVVGEVIDTADSDTQFLWQCQGTQSTDYCSLDKPTTDPSYNVSPDGASIEVYKTVQFSAKYNSDETGNSTDESDVTNLSNWTSSNPSFASIATTGNTGRGLATCLKPTEGNDVVITATYKNEKDIVFTDTATLSCLTVDPPNYSLTVNIIGKGKVFGLIDCDQSTSPCKKEFSVVDSGSITALPDVGYSFIFDKGWTDNLNKTPKSCSSSIGNIYIADIDTDDHSEGDNYCDLTMTSHKEVTVMFEKNPLAPSYRLEPISATQVIGESFQFNGYYDSDGDGPIEEVEIDNSKATWSEEDSDNENDIASINATGLATCKLADTNGSNIYSSYLGIKASASLVCTEGINGKCDIVEGPNECDDGVSKDIVDSPNQYLWQCIGTKSTDDCSLDKLKVTADISANLAFAEIGGTAIISWKSTNATSCKPVSGSGDAGWIDANRSNYSFVGYPDAEEYEATLTVLPITFKITCTNGETSATDEVTIDKKNTIPDPSYNVSPDHAFAYVYGTQQFSSKYNSDETGTSADESSVTNLATWMSSNPSIASITSSGDSGRGLATCLKPSAEGDDIVVTSTYKNENNTEFTDTATLSCLPVDPPNYSLVVNIVGKGKVFGLIDCDQSKCAKDFDEGDSGSITALPDAGYSFNLSGWSDNLSKSPEACSSSLNNIHTADRETEDHSEGDNYCDLTMTSNKEVTVVFEEDPIYEISPSVAKTEVDKTVHFSGLWSDKKHYPQDVTNAAEWNVVDENDNNDDSIATFKNMWLEKGEAKCVSVGTAYASSSYGGLNDKAELICDDKIVPNYTLAVAKTGDGYGEITGAVKCDIDCVSASKEYSKDSVVEITASALEGSTFNGWSGACSGKNPVCELTMFADKDATASFAEDTSLLPKAYISADNTSVDSGGFTTVVWKSDNAVKCVNEYGGSDTDWVGDRGIGGSYSTSSFQPEEERVYGVTCYDKFGNYDSVSIDVSAGGIDIPAPSVDLIAEPDEVEIVGTSKLSWLSSNTKSCEIISDDDSKKSWNNLGSFGSIDTSVLDVAPKEYSYTISCKGDDDSFVEDEVVVETKEKEVICENNCGTGKIEITAVSDTITAIIVAGLTAKSEKSKITVSSQHCKNSMANLDFEYKNGNGPGEAFIEKNSFPMAGVTLGEVGGFFIKNINGKTDPGIYPIEITAECFDKDDNSKKLTGIKSINLKVKTIFSSDWLEF